MNNLATHMRISGVTVSDSDVESRKTAITSLVTSWTKIRAPSNIISKVVDIAAVLGGDGTPSPELGEEIQTAIQKKSPSFLYEERYLDISVCAGLSMLSVLGNTPTGSGWTIVDVYAAALWSSLSYQPVLNAERRENLRREVLNAATDFCVASADKARKRSDVPDPSSLKITIDDENNVTNNFNAAITQTIETLRSNAALDREELDYLWWAQLGRSRLLKKQLSDINEPTRLVAAGIEGAMILRRLPCEVHREIVLRTLDQDIELDLAELLTAIGEDRAALLNVVAEKDVLAYPSVFPLLHALVTGEVEGAAASIKRPVSEWGARALLETAFVRFLPQGISKL